MLKKLVVVLIATLFSVSVAGLSYAQTKPGDKPADKPAVTPADKPGDKPAAGEMTKKKATKKKTVKKKTTKKKMGEVPGPVEK